MASGPCAAAGALAFGLALAFGGPAHATPTAEPTPRDPNDAPPLRAPHGQPRHDSDVWQPPLDDNADRSRRFSISLQPSFAAWRVGLIGRPAVPIRGLGALVEVDVRIWRTLWLRISGSHTVHPVQNHYGRNDEEEIVQTAASGLLQASGASLGLAQAFDLGRFLPMIELGLGALFVRTPDAVQDGQMNGTCRSDGTCDAGLRCAPDNMCRLGMLPAIHGGLGFDVLLGDHWTAGAGLRYYAIATAPGAFPIYLTAVARLGVRW